MDLELLSFYPYSILTDASLACFPGSLYACVLLGHPLADPKRCNSMHQHEERQACEPIET